MKSEEYLVSGIPFIIDKPIISKNYYELTPKQTRNIFNDFGWQSIIGFHTRNIIHKGHEFIQKKALEKIHADAIFISPVVGIKKAGDFSAQAILDCYNTMIKNGHYKPYGVLLSVFNSYSRYSGPREAVFTAICRKNFGCSHFIVGRDHTGVGNFYSPYASQKLFEELDIGMGILTFNTAYFCTSCNTVTMECSHGENSVLTLSGTKIRKALIEGVAIPRYLVQSDISKILQDLYRENPNAVFEVAS